MLGNGAMRPIGASVLDVLDKMLLISVGMVVNLGGQRRLTRCKKS